MFAWIVNKYYTMNDNLKRQNKINYNKNTCRVCFSKYIYMYFFINIVPSK